jgi:hypothetical protein
LDSMPLRFTFTCIQLVTFFQGLQPFTIGLISFLSLHFCHFPLHYCHAYHTSDDIITFLELSTAFLGFSL